MRTQTLTIDLDRMERQIADMRTVLLSLEDYDDDRIDMILHTLDGINIQIMKAAQSHQIIQDNSRNSHIDYNANLCCMEINQNFDGLCCKIIWGKKEEDDYLDKITSELAVCKRRIDNSVLKLLILARAAQS